MIVSGGIVLAVLAGVAWVVFILAHILVLVLTVAAVVAAYRLGRLRGTRAQVTSGSPGCDPKVIQGHAVDPERERAAQLEAELSRVRQLVADIEDAAGRPVEAIIASYRHIQRQYKTGDRR